MQRFYSDKHLEKIAKKALYEKYNEEFEVKKIYQQVRTDFFAVCSPVKDDTVVFEARLYKNGELIYDHYLDETIEDEIRDKVGKCFANLWNDYYVYGKSSYAFKLNERNKEYSLGSYVDLTYELAEEDGDNDPNPYATVVIYLPSSVYIDSDPKDEYEIFENEVQELVNKHEIPPITVNVYVIADNQLQHIKEFYEKYAVEKSILRDMRGKKRYQFIYDKNNGKLKIDYEEYCKIRKEAIENE